MANEAITWPLGGIVGELRRHGINVVPDYDDPTNTTIDFIAATTFTGATDVGDVNIESGETLTVEDGGTLRLDGGSALEVETGAVTLSSNAGTLSQLAGKITTEALTTAAGAAETLTITNTLVAATDIIILTRNGGTSDEGTPEVTVTPGSGSFVITLENRHASAAFDGTFIFGFLVIKQAA